MFVSLYRHLTRHIAHTNCPTKIVAYLAIPLALSGCFGEPEYLDQNWNEDNQLREQSYHTSQGSQLLPYDWFIHLKVANSPLKLNSAPVYESLRYLPDYAPDPILNPDALAIGFVKDVDPNTGTWLGINCSACHTGQIIYNEHVLRIDGAPAMGDYTGLLTTVRDAIAATASRRHRFNQFAAALGLSQKAAKTELREQMLHQADLISAMINNAYSAEHKPGYGRIDAFAAIRNEVFVTDLGITENYQTPSAPVSYPFLWDTPHLDKVQWAGNVENPYARNTGQVLGVMGQLDLQNPNNLFNSSVRRDNLFLLEEWLAELKSPTWPEHILGAINNQAAQRGKHLYSTADASGYSCESCHSLPDASGLYPLTPATDNAFGLQFIQTQTIPIAEVGTDPNTLTNIYDPTLIQTGLLAGVFGQTEMVGAQLLSLITRATVGQLFSQSPALSPEQQGAYSRFRIYAPGVTPPLNPIGYKARPLNGIWATAPYLHNASVPNLYELLLPPEERSKQFWTGNMLFNPQWVGFETFFVPGAQRFDTQISGNRNFGHEYGTHLTHAERLDLVEFLKTL